MSWLEKLARGHPFAGAGKFPIRAYSEFLPAPFVAVKPYGEPEWSCRFGASDRWSVSEHEEHEELRPGFERIAQHVLLEVGKLVRGEKHAFSKHLLDGNPAWSPDLVGKTRELTLVLPLALSRTQDDKGNVRWTLFGTSHQGPARAYWMSFPSEEAWRVHLAFLDAPKDTRVIPLGENPEWGAHPLPAWAKKLVLHEEDAPPAAVFTFRPWQRLPAKLRAAYLEGKTRILPSPATLVFFWHPDYTRLEKTLPRARQVALLNIFPHASSALDIRIPQSGWFDEHCHEGHLARRGHVVKHRIARPHRWQRVERDEVVELDDKVSIALFSTNPDDLGLYGKPMARNAQVWSEGYELILDGPRATRREIEAAERALGPGGHFGYRYYFPPMRVLEHEVFWHRPIVARREGDRTLVQHEAAPLGHLSAEKDGATTLEIRPEVASRELYLESALAFTFDPGRKRRTTSHNIRKLLDWRTLLERPLPRSLARRLITAKKEETLDEWLGSLPMRATDPDAGKRVEAGLRSVLGPDAEPGEALTFEATRTRAFEERYWKTIAALALGRYRTKGVADCVSVNEGRTGGEKASLVQDIARRGQRDLEALGDHLHAWYRGLEAVPGAVCADHVFRWETDFDFAWSRSWLENREAPRERNIFFVIPGRDRGEAVIMADHYDTAYMEDCYDPSRGGDRLRAAAAGADDNHSATAALMLAAEPFLALAREGKLERDIWLVHLTGEEFPADCLGARNLAQALVEGTLALRKEDGSSLDLGKTRVRGAFVLDMIAHNNDRDRDVFQIAAGRGRGAARLAWHAHLANERWNRSAPAWNKERKARGRSKRVETGMPEIAEHPVLAGEVRVEWSPRSALYNTDGQIFSDVGVPCVLFMENYDIRREGYHDTQDTMKNIDLDYGSALAAIAIETVARVACARDV
ncbi:MAG TPA: M28 family peptidase [Planctomycetota bacterium]|nr:M28 family peptidase [Planctomycetota bacterium]